MKVQRRSVPLDMLAVENKNQRILISTHRHEVHFYASTGDKTNAQAALSFEQLFRLIETLEAAP